MQSWVWRVSNFNFLAPAYKGGWLELSLTISFSHWQCAHYIAELAIEAATLVTASLSQTTDKVFCEALQMLYRLSALHTKRLRLKR